MFIEGQKQVLAAVVHWTAMTKRLLRRSAYCESMKGGDIKTRSWMAIAASSQARRPRIAIGWTS